ncbi:hypothetical protein [Acidovorax sp. SUPP3334]|uniref:hypothetical protein n=1 Tax=Acidovorax sp. SUPP3334 TaxID=2920881 RepID=UPI0023DE257B|nr:hypothetical protein [Acidovorax sp. SUPP3334]GKT27156.1 PqqD family protein [Acidovorax sp. SUPP3334]
MTSYDAYLASQTSKATIRLASSIHLREEAQGGALVVDDQTLTAAHINKSAYILFQALSRPRTVEGLVSILAEAAKCPVSEAFAPVATLVEEATRLGWIETHEADIGS